MSHLPLSLMNRLNKTESAVFKLWMLYFQRIFFTDYMVGEACLPSNGYFPKTHYYILSFRVLVCPNILICHLYIIELCNVRMALFSDYYNQIQMV